MKLTQKCTSLLLTMLLLGSTTCVVTAENSHPPIPAVAQEETAQHTLFPVYVVQKTGDDAKRNVWLIVGDGYTQEEQDKFIHDMTARVEKIMDMEPFRYFNRGMNIYALQIPSKESGAGRDFNKDGTGGIIKDTYFRVRHNSCGLERLAWFNGEGEQRLEALKKDLETHYLDPGGHIIQTIILSNSDTYFGGGAAFDAVSSLAAGEAMMVHEASHGFANLADEYNGHPEESPNKTKQTNLKKVPWKEFFGFRGVTLYKYGDGAQKPIPGDCIMNSLYQQHGYCEVCKEHVAEVLNKNLKDDSHLYYMAEPSLTLKEEDPLTTGKTITEANLEEANHHQLQYRTVVKNFTKKTQTYTLSLAIIGGDGKLKYETTENFSVKPGKLQSLAIVTPVMEHLQKGDTMKMAAKLVRK